MSPTPPVPGALDLLEEAVHVLRRSSAATLACYYGATLPFVLGLLFFWADASRAPDAESSTAEATLGLAALFLVMKTGQAVFAERLRAGLRLGTGGEAAAPRWTAGRLGRLFLVQATLQPSGLFVLPLAALVALPFGWVFAFYQNLTVLGDSAAGSVRTAVARAGRAARYAPRQNHGALAVMTLLALVVWIDGRVGMEFLPQMARLFSGSENVFTRGGEYLTNSTFLAASLALLYVIVDPLVKAFYALRCFYADARRTGEDLRREIRRLPGGKATAMRAAAMAAALLTLTLPLPGLGGRFGNAHAQAAPPAPVAAPAPAVAPPALDRSIEEVLRRREFAWRLPRDGERNPAAKKEPGAIARWFERMGKRIDELRQWWRSLWETSPKPQKPKSDQPRTPVDWVAQLLQPLTYALIGIGVLAGLWMFWNARRRRRAAEVPAIGAAGGAGAGADDPDAGELADEALLATRLPEDEWLRLGRELRGRGERRLALRAFYLSILAGLAARGLVNVARHKSNGDYLRETQRRARDRAGVAEAFTEAVRVFERPWYGEHAADDAALDALLTGRERILPAAAAAV